MIKSWGYKILVMVKLCFYGEVANPEEYRR